MLTKRTSYIVALLSMFVLVSVVTVPMFSDDSDAKALDSTGIDYIYTGGSQSLSAGTPEDISFLLTNNNTSNKVLSVSAEISAVDSNLKDSDVTVKFGDDVKSPFLLEQSKTIKVTMTVTPDKYAHTSEDKILVTIKVFDTASSDPDDPSTYQTGTFDIGISIGATLASEDYNKFFGIYPNEFDGFLGSVWFTGIVSFLGLLAIGYVVMFIAVPVCSRILMKKDDPNRATLKKLLYRLCQFIIWLWVIRQILRIFGSNEELIDFVNKLFYFAYIVVGAFVGWKIYKLLISTLINRVVARAAEYEMDEKRMDFESFRPLFMYLGEIVLSIVTVMLIMNLFGFDLGAIITSAGLVSLGISMGAQDVLKQFFAGLEILATRPFKKGDIVTIGTDSTVFVVKKVNVMNTFLANWDNTDVNIMPNSTITTSKIRNMTRETLMWKVYLSIEVSYGTDVNLARALVQEAANQNPHVITDGSVKKPYTRLDAFGDDNLIIKMGFYVDDYNNQYSVSGQIRQDIIQKFNENEINIDYAQIVVHQAEPELRGNTTAKVIPRNSS